MKKYFFRDTRGQGLVELALVLPVLILLLMGIMDMGRLFGGYLELQHVAREGARYASTNYKSDLDSESITDVGNDDSWVSGTFTSWVNDHLTLLDETDLTIELITEPYNTQSSKNDPDDQESVEVRFQYPMEIITPVVGSLVGSPVNLKARMVMRIE